MAIKHLEWLSRNNLRSFPIREDAPRVSTSGFVIPDNLLVDLFLCVPDEPQGVYISSVCLTPKIITIVFASVATNITLATASAFPETERGLKSKPINPLVDGVAGFVTFGSFLSDGFKSAASSYSGSNMFTGSCIIEAKCLTMISSFPVSSIRASAATKTITGAAIVIPGGYLNMETTSGTDTDDEIITYVTLSLSASDLSAFAPACATVPDKALCSRRPILSINDAVPDLNGNITIEFIDMITEQIVHILKISLLATGTIFCTQVELPDSLGRLPPNYVD